MTLIGWLQILVFFALIAGADEAARRLHVPRLRGGAAAAAARARPVERALYRLCGVDPRQEQTWGSTRSRCWPSARSACSSPTLIQRLQQRAAAQPAAPRRRRADARVQHRGQLHDQHQLAGATRGESTMSYLTQMAGLAWHNFISAAAGIGVALALARGFTRRPGPDGAQDARQLLGRPRPRHRSTCCCRSASSSRWSSSRRA